MYLVALLSIVVVGLLLAKLNKRMMKGGVCRYCQCEVAPGTDICDPCWSNNNAW